MVSERFMQRFVLFGVSGGVRRGFRGYRRTGVKSMIATLLLSVLMLVSMSAASAAPGDMVGYGVFETDSMEAAAIVGVMDAGNMSYAQEMVSVDGFEEFAEGFGGFEDYELARLSASEKRALSDADEYLVYDGYFPDFVGSSAYGYTVMVAYGSDVLVIMGPDEHREAGFEIVEAFLGRGVDSYISPDYIIIEM